MVRALTALYSAFEPVAFESLSHTLGEAPVDAGISSGGEDVRGFITEVHRVTSMLVNELEARGYHIKYTTTSIDTGFLLHAWTIIVADEGTVVLYFKPHITVYDVEAAISRAEEVAEKTSDDYEVIPAVAGRTFDPYAEKYAKSLDMPVFRLRY